MYIMRTNAATPKQILTAFRARYDRVFSLERIDETLGTVVGPSLLAQAHEFGGSNGETVLAILAITVSTANPKKYDVFRCPLERDVTFNADFPISQ